MTDPRLVEPQRAAPADVADAEAGCDEHVYWCWKRITGAVLLGALLLALAAWAIRSVR